jgi:hypothetical protein
MFAREESQNEELNGLETALRSLKPAGTVDRDRLMYLAGQASVQPAIRPFLYRSIRPMAMAASVMLAALLGRVTAPEHVQVIDRVVQIPAQIDHQQLRDYEQFAEAIQASPINVLPRASSQGTVGYRSEELPVDREIVRPYFRLRDQVVALGPDMLPALGKGTQPGEGKSHSYFDIRHDLLK